MRVNEHARGVRVVDLSHTGAQVRPAGGGNYPLGAKGVLTVEFSEFGTATSHVKVIRCISDGESFGLRFVDPPSQFMRLCHGAIRQAMRSDHPGE